MAKINAVEFSKTGDKYLGWLYTEMDCQGFVEHMMEDSGLNMNLKGSNAWFRKMTWVGTPEECKAKFGSIPVGALLYIWKNDGGEVARGYKDGLGNASHIGVYIGREDGAIHSSSSRGCVAYSVFKGKSIKGGWNRVGLYDVFDYGEHVNKLLSGDNQSEKGVSTMLYTATVKSSNGKGANLRSKQSTSSTLIVAMPEGATVEVLEELGSWRKISYNDKIGYVLASLLVKDEFEKETEPVTITIPYKVAYELRDALINAMGVG